MTQDVCRPRHLNSTRQDVNHERVGCVQSLEIVATRQAAPVEQPGVSHCSKALIVHSVARPLVVSYTSSGLELRRLASADYESLKATNAVSLTAGALQAADTRS